MLTASGVGKLLMNELFEQVTVIIGCVRPVEKWHGKVEQNPA